VLLRHIRGVLDQDRLARARAMLSRLHFADGLQPLVDLVRESLFTREEFAGVAFPRKYLLNFNRYEQGMRYGDHNDAAIVGSAQGTPVRSDLSFTLFLAEPDSYDGGELVVETPGGATALKPPAGDAVLYTSGTLHRVEPVTRGVRLAAFGWVQSCVRDEAQREILTRLRATRARLIAERGGAAEIDELGIVYNNLMRLWAEN
jgi:PKHD-type hydroxylase